MRCPAVVVEATNDIIRAADEAGHLGKRIQKRYDPFPRAELDARYPTIRVVKSSVQTPKANLFGKYILREIFSIPENEISESLEKGFPTVLIIGSKPYSEQVQAFLEENGIRVEAKDRNRASVDDPFTRNDGFAALKANDRSNIGWRILLEIDRPKGCESWITASIETGAPLCELIDATFCDEIFGELETWTPPDVEDDAEASNEATENVPTVRLTSFEGAKGMSAQHVFVLGLEDGRFPADRNRPRTLDVRRMIVALTRTRKQCHLLRVSQRFSRKGRQLIRQSVFMDWIQPGRKDEISIKANDFKA